MTPQTVKNIKQDQDEEIISKLLRNSQRTAKIVLSLFDGRERVFARQLSKGGYNPVRRAIKPKDIIQHLKGGKTVGVYLVKRDNTVTFGCLDPEIPKGIPMNEQSRKRARALGLVLKSTAEKAGIPILLENSGGDHEGHHLWFFFEKPVLAALGKKLGEAIINGAVLEHPEVFIKTIKEMENPTEFINLLTKMGTEGTLPDVFSILPCPAKLKTFLSPNNSDCDAVQLLLARSL